MEKPYNFFGKILIEFTEFNLLNCEHVAEV